MGTILKNKKFKSMTKKNEQIFVNLNKVDEKEVYQKGDRTLKDLIAPSGVDRSDLTKLVIGNKHVRSYIVKGYPSQVYVSWLDKLINYDGDMDVTLHIEPVDDREAIEDLTKKISQYEAQLEIEEKKGEIRNGTRYRDMISQLMVERRKLEQNLESLFHVQVCTNLYSESAESLEKESQKIENQLKGQKIYLMPVYYRQDDAYKNCLPYGKVYITDMFRNFNSGALTACFPFYNSEISHTNGVLCGRNITTGTNIFIDFYDRKKLNNSNITVIGQAGSGKTFFVSLLTLRSACRGIRSVIIDPEGEYNKVTQAVGGTCVLISEDSNQFINIFDLEEEDVTDDNGFPTGEKYVSIKNKVSDVLNLIAIMAGGLSQEDVAIVSSLLQLLYESRGFNENPESLYVKESFFDNQTGKFYHDGVKKPMPIFSDFYELLDKYSQQSKNENVNRLLNSLSVYKKGGLHDMFDRQTSADLMNYSNSIVVNFDISKLEENVLRPIGMYICMTFAWEKFAKKNPQIRKRIVCDEAWMLVNKNMKGHEYTAAFLETTSRRIRKRNGGLLVASQNFTEFADSKQGRAVLTNSVVNIFLKQKDIDASALQSTFNLSDGEKIFLLQAQKGEALFKLGGESLIGRVEASKMELDLIEKKYTLAS